MAQEADDEPRPLETITEVVGSEERQLNVRLLATDSSGTHLFEERNAWLHQIAPGSIKQQTALTEPFRYLSVEELSAELLRSFGGGFAVKPTKRFLVCSNGSDEYAAFVAELLEKVADEYFAFWDESPVTVSEPAIALPVIIFRAPEQYRQFAQQQHPDVDFTSVPGYYSVRFNQMLLPEDIPAGDAETRRDLVRYLKGQSRQVETIVHEAVHQLAFNSGLQVRYADSPLWLTEGLAVYFEGVANRGSLLWTGPGRTSPLHLQNFQVAATGGELSVPLDALTTSNLAFQSSDDVAAAYAEGWALSYFLIRRNRDAFNRLAISMQGRQPVVAVSPDLLRTEFATCVQQSAADLTPDLIRYMSRIRPPR